MLRLVGVAISVGLADSMNPSTVGPAMFLAAAGNGARRVAEFTLGVFGVNLIAGLLLAIGPGRLLLDLVPHPQVTVRHFIELIAGLILVGVAVALWAGRRTLARRELPGRRTSGSSALVMGASLAAVELPTAAPYFAVIAGAVAAPVSVPAKVVLLALYNLAFVLPLLVIAAVLCSGSDRADRWLRRGARWLQRRWPVALACVLLLIGGGLTIAGAAGLLKQ